MNDAGASQCARCNFPLDGSVTTSPPAPAPSDAAPAPEISRERIRPVRPRRPGTGAQSQQSQLVIAVGAVALIAAGFAIYSTWQEFQKTQTRAVVEGAKPEEPQRADVARAAIAKDSTNVNAQVAHFMTQIVGFPFHFVFVGNQATS